MDLGNKILTFLIVLAVLAFALIAGDKIGSASAYDTQMERKYQMECIDHGGHMEYVTNVGKVCKK